MTWTIATDDGPKPHTECQFRFSETRYFTRTVGRERRCGDYNTVWMCGNPAAIGSPCASFACILYCGDVEVDDK
jgi:hypothetical protein